MTTREQAMVADQIESDKLIESLMEENEKLTEENERLEALVAELRRLI